MPGRRLAWEGWVLEQIVQTLGQQWELSFYRTASGAELDVVAERRRQRVAFEIKLSSAPMMNKGFWSALKPERTFVIAPVTSAYPLAPEVEVIPATGLADCLVSL